MLNVCFLPPVTSRVHTTWGRLHAQACQYRKWDEDLHRDQGWRHALHFTSKREVLSSWEVELGFQEDIK
jgi:hypothetical protein